MGPGDGSLPLQGIGVRATWFQVGRLPLLAIEHHTGLPALREGGAAAGVDEVEGPDAQAQAGCLGAAAEIEVVEVKGEGGIKAQAGAAQPAGPASEEHPIEQGGGRGAGTVGLELGGAWAAVAQAADQVGPVPGAAIGLEPPGLGAGIAAAVARHPHQVKALQGCRQLGR